MGIAAIVACEMIEDETRLAIERALPEDDRPPLVWIEAALHERPAKLKARLAELIGQLDEGARAGESVLVQGVRPGAGPAEERLETVEVRPTGDIVLGYGYCGGGLEGLVSQERRLIFLRAHDCVQVLLYDESGQSRRDTRSYYVTRGWFCHPSSFSGMAEDWIERHGREALRRLWTAMFASYKHLTLIDTGAFDAEEVLPLSEARAAEWGLEHRIVPGSVDGLQRLFAGTALERDTIVLEPGQCMRLDYLVCATG